MKELYKTNRLILVVAAIVLILVVGLITFKKPEVKYLLSTAETIALLNDSSLMVTPKQVSGLLKDNDGKTVFIDVRNSVAFDISHVKNAVNVPVRELFSKMGKSVFHDIDQAGQTTIIYGETQQQANGPWLMLRQTGMKNVLLFTGSFAQLDLQHADSVTNHLPQLSETPCIDTMALKALQATVVTEKKSELPVKTEKKELAPVKKAASSGGGC